MPSISEPLIHYSHIIALICCFIFNSILILCMLKEKHHQIKMYCKLLYLQCTCDMIAGVFYYFGAGRFIMVEGIFYVFYIHPWLKVDSVNFFGWEIPPNWFGAYTYLFPTGLPILFVPLSFYFRYLQLCR